MSLPGFVEYKRREYCKDIKCPVQIQLNQMAEKSDAYEKLRKTCQTACIHTTYEFHHWLIKQGYLILKPNTSTQKRQT